MFQWLKAERVFKVVLINEGNIKLDGSNGNCSPVINKLLNKLKLVSFFLNCLVRKELFDTEAIWFQGSYLFSIKHSYFGPVVVLHVFLKPYWFDVDLTNTNQHGFNKTKQYNQLWQELWMKEIMLCLQVLISVVHLIWSMYISRI